LAWTLVLALCSAACQQPHQLSLTVLPTDELVYKIPDEIGFESWHFGLTVTGDPTPDFDELEVSDFAGGLVVKQTTYARGILTGHRAEEAPAPNALVYRNFHILSPIAAKVDSLRLRLRSAGATVAERVLPVVAYEQRRPYRLPVRGCWLVSSGHDFGPEHRRWYNRSHFAWDLVRVDAAGRPRGEGDGLQSYFSFGAPILAPADGHVVLAKDDSPDNRAGVIGKQGTTNFLLINHGDGEFSKLGHIQQGSLRVKAGERVRAGQVIALVGNNGRSDAPHLHFHFQRTLFDAGGLVVGEEPLPVLLSDYRVTSNKGVGLAVARGRPRRGEFVCAN